MAECHILDPQLFALVAPLRALLQRLGFKRRGDVHLTLADQGADVLVTGFSPTGWKPPRRSSAFVSGTASRASRSMTVSARKPAGSRSR